MAFGFICAKICKNKSRSPGQGLRDLSKYGILKVPLRR